MPHHRKLYHELVIKHRMDSNHIHIGISTNYCGILYTIWRQIYSIVKISMPPFLWIFCNKLNKYSHNIMVWQNKHSIKHTFLNKKQKQKINIINNSLFVLMNKRFSGSFRRYMPYTCKYINDLMHNWSDKKSIRDSWFRFWIAALFYTFDYKSTVNLDEFL